MKGIKNAAVMTLMLGVLYAVYVTLSKPDPPLPKEFQPADIAALGPPQVDFGGTGDASPQVEMPVSSHSNGSYSPHNHAPKFADSRPTRGGSYQANPLAPEESTAIAQQYENPNDNPANVEVPVVPEIPPVEQPTAEPPPTRRGSVYGSAPQANNDYAPTETPNEVAQTSAPALGAPESRNPALTLYSLKQDWNQAEQSIQQGKLADALALLSKYYGHPDLGPADQQQINKWLDALAGRVIYSTEHYLAPPYKVRGTESLLDVAEQYNVPWQLLQNINVVRDPTALLPGTMLKVVPGPFRADVDLARGELTLFLGEMYAGRFPFALGDEPPQPGEYRIADKKRDRVYVGQGQRTVNGADPDNPYGGWYLDLGREASIHGSPRTSSGSQTLGCISLSPQDAKDIYGILSLGSTVVIKR